MEFMTIKEAAEKWNLSVRRDSASNIQKGTVCISITEDNGHSGILQARIGFIMG